MVPDDEVQDDNFSMEEASEIQNEKEVVMEGAGADAGQGSSPDTQVTATSCVPASSARIGTRTQLASPGENPLLNQR